VRILFIGSTDPESTSLYYFSSFSQLGHRVDTWNPRFFETKGPITALLQRIRKAPSDSQIRQKNSELVRLCHATRYDLVFIMGETFFTPETIEAIGAANEGSTKTVFHSHDNVFASGVLKGDRFLESLKYFHTVFTTKSKNPSRYQALGQERSFFLPSAFEPSVHRPIPLSSSRLQREFGVSFIGTYDGSRLPYLNSVGWERLQVWGNGWSRFPQFPQFKAHITPSAVYGFDFADACSRSLCCLGLLREEAGDLHTQRTFEIPACGTLQVAPRNEEILGFFDEDKEIVLFDSMEELKEKVDFYLSHPSARNAIARAGYERCVKGAHTYLDRTRAILEMAERA
jgi:spore maturation protein CgeB